MPHGKARFVAEKLESVILSLQGAFDTNIKAFDGSLNPESYKL